MKSSRWSSERTELLIAGVYVFFFAVGTAGHYISATRDLMLRLTPAILLVFGMSVTVPLAVRRAWSVLGWILVTYLVTFALEAIGVATGKVFGVYEYGPTLGVAAFSVPLIIGFNWVIVVLGSISLVEWLLGIASRSGRQAGARRRGGRVVRYVVAPALVGALAVVFDLALEPVAIHFNYWQWDGSIVPLQNYIAWFVIAAAAALPYFALARSSGSRLPAYYVGVQFAFIVSLLPLLL